MTVQFVVLTEFKNRTSYYLSKAEEGQIINIVSGGELIARVFPPSQALEEHPNIKKKIKKSGKKLSSKSH